MRAAPKTRGTQKLAVERLSGVAHNNHLEAVERDAKMAPALRELSHLSDEKAADELERLGFGKMSHMTVLRARARLGMPRPRRRAAKRAKRARMANEEAAVE